MTDLTYEYEINLSNWALFLQGQIKPVENVKVVGGCRWDWFKQSFENIVRPENSGTGYPYIRSPKIGLVITPMENFNIFGNIGCGFRSPSNTEVSPYQTNRNANFSLEPAMVQTFDLGCNVALFGKFFFAADYYNTYTEREIRTIEHEPVNIGNTLREGYELEMEYFPVGSQNFSLFASYAWVDATVPDPTNPGQHKVTYVSEHLVKAGVSMKKDFGPYGKVTTDLDYQYASGIPCYVGSAAQKPLYSPDWDIYNFRLTYEGNGWSSFLAVQCQPREYAASYSWVSTAYGNSHCYNPQPKWQVASGLKYIW
jgi:outer membrane receptor protein involved in Fe transport